MLVRFLLTLVGGLALIVLLAWVFQRRLIYMPMTGSVPAVESVLPGAQEAVLRTADGLELGAWFLPATGTTTKRAVIVFNGNAGDRSYRAPMAQAFARAGFSVLLFDYRGYGGNPGSSSEAGLREDARAARRWLEGREDVDPKGILYLGESLGCGVAVGLAAERPPLILVLRSPFPSLTEVGRIHYPFLPVRLLMRDRFDCLDIARRLACPLLVIAGEGDRIVPAPLSRRLYEAAPEPKHFLLLPGADHNDEVLVDGERLAAETVRFMEQVARIPK